MTEEQIVSELGEPDEQKVGRTGDLELYFPSTTCVVEAAHGLTQVHTDTPHLTIGTVHVLFGGLVAFLRDRDPETFETVGFVVSHAFGIACDPDQPSWVIAYAPSRVDRWQV